MSKSYPQDRVPFVKGFPTDYPIRPSNQMQFDWWVATRNILTLWMPEGIAAREGRLLQLLREDVSFIYDRTPEGWWRHTFTKPGVMKMKGIFEEIQDGVRLILTIENMSENDYNGVHATVCLRFPTAPDFYDLERARTFYMNDGKLRFLHEAQLSGPENGACIFYKPLKNHPPDASFIGIASKDGSHVCATWWQGAAGVSGNCHPATHCIHSNPGFGDIPPGKKVVREGRIYMMPGGPEDAWKRFMSDQAAINGDSR